MYSLSDMCTLCVCVCVCVSPLLHIVVAVKVTGVQRLVDLSMSVWAGLGWGAH